MLRVSAVNALGQLLREFYGRDSFSGSGRSGIIWARRRRPPAQVRDVKCSSHDFGECRGVRYREQSHATRGLPGVDQAVGLRYPVTPVFMLLAYHREVAGNILEKCALPAPAALFV
jgi:hypothetical protein